MISLRYRGIFIHQHKTAERPIISSFGLTPEQAKWHRYGAPDEGWKHVETMRDRPRLNATMPGYDFDGGITRAVAVKGNRVA